jgi:prevent-host-death family protein
MKYSESIKPISYVKNNMAQIIQQINQDQGTMIITQNGEAKAALVDIRKYEDTLETQGRRDIAQGNFQPVEDVFAELEADLKEGSH